MECKINDILIHYDIIGEGKSVVMIHGFYPDHRLMVGCMEPVFQKENKYKRIYFDLPGMGKSGSAPWIANSDKMLDLVVDFIEKIIPNENFLLAGESYGGYLARGVISRMPDRIDGVALICPAILPDIEKRTVPEHVVLVKDDRLLSHLTAEEAEDFNESAVVQSETIYERYKKEVMSGVEIANSEFLQTLRKNRYGFSFNVDQSKRKFQKPSVIMVGRQDSCVGYRDAWAILKNFPRATFAVLDGAGHNLQIEQQMLFNSLMKEWLIRVSQS